MTQEETSEKKANNIRQKLSGIFTYKNIEPWITLIAGILLFFEVVPKTLRENLEKTVLGLYLVFLLIILKLISLNRQQFKGFIKAQENDFKLISSKETTILELNKTLSIKNNQLLELSKTTNYSRILSTINKAFAELRQAQREDLVSKDGEKLKAAIKEFCNTLHEVFDVLKGQEGKSCHVCIKVCTVDSAAASGRDSAVQLKMKTLMRDGRGNGSRAQIDNKTHIPHYVSENTDFMHILVESSDSNNAKHFMSNDVLTLDEYKNSSFRAIKENKDNCYYKYAHAPMEEKIANWKLGYRSTIVSAISPGMSKPSVEDGTFIGFLCVDYDVPNIFTQADTDIVEGFAEGLYDALNQYLQQYILKNTQKTA